MRFYIIQRKFVNLIPLEMYKDKIVVLYWAMTRVKNESTYGIEYDYRFYYRAPTFKYLALYNLTDEDLTHLNLLGLPINYSTSMMNQNLEDAINNGADRFDFISKDQYLS